jgi:hypothetical protein
VVGVGQLFKKALMPFVITFAVRVNDGSLAAY